MGCKPVAILRFCFLGVGFNFSVQEVFLPHKTSACFVSVFGFNWIPQIVSSTDTWFKHFVPSSLSSSCCINYTFCLLLNTSNYSPESCISPPASLSEALAHEILLSKNHWLAVITITHIHRVLSEGKSKLCYSKDICFNTDKVHHAAAST